MFIDTRLIAAWIHTDTQVEVRFSPHKTTFPEYLFSIPGLEIESVVRSGDCYCLETTAVDIQKSYTLYVHGMGVRPLFAGQILNQYYSEKSLGCSIRNNRSTFRVFAPRAQKMQLVLFAGKEDIVGEIHNMRRDRNGVWEVMLEKNCAGQFYVYRMNGKQPTKNEVFTELDIADPYSRSVVRSNHYLHHSRTHIPDDAEFDWEGDTWITPKMNDLIIYEMHVRDMTVHTSSGVSEKNRGSYSGLVEQGKKGGFDHIRSLGVNAVELLPVQEFANIEPPFQVQSGAVRNTWNPYARNHWGYMTSFFFAPDAYYASGANLKHGECSGGEERILTEFKEMVKAFHKQGIAVILDVVYNHVSQYDLNPLKEIDREYYFRLNSDGSYESKSYCGNDFFTERRMARRLITDSLIYWMQEFHIDGFRFDLAGLLDEGTLDAITAETRRINPDVILIAEPWGGDNYGQTRYSKRGWGAWNDRFRNGVKGQNPVDGHSFIFESIFGDTHVYSMMKRLICGSIQSYGGPFVSAETSINYLESHDEWTLGDFVRIASGEVPVETKVTQTDKHVKLTQLQSKIHALAAVVLFTSQGGVMIHAGQEFAKSQVIAPEQGVDDVDVSRMDHNSYNKDNMTNYIDYSHAATNKWLVDYYRGLIQLRNTYSQFRQNNPDLLHFMHGSNPFSLGYLIKNENTSADNAPFLVLLNASRTEISTFFVPEGEWSLMVSSEQSGIDEIKLVKSGRFELQPVSAVVMRKK